MDTTLAAHASALLGLVLPLLVQVTKLHLVKVSDKLAHALSLALAFGAVAVARVALHQGISLAEIVPDASTAWALSQVVYRQLEGTPLAKLFTPGRPAPAPAPAPADPGTDAP